MRTHPKFRVVGAVSAWTAPLLVLAACSNSSSTPSSIVNQPFVHRDIVLRDVAGEALTADSTEPYSPRMTCGRCHDVDAIASGYHFQQGRTDSTGRLDPRLLRPWDQQVAVLSPGMFGKW
ncbi:MAG: hypothetical protein R3F56_12155 [Planctomycetota bacterium]